MQSTSHSIRTAPPGEGKDSTSPPPPKLAVQLVHHHDLFVAASAGDLLTSRALLDRGLRLIVGAGNLTDSLGRLDVNAVNADGATAMYIAAAHGHTALVEVLADEGGADVNVGTREDSTLQLVEAWKDDPPSEFIRSRRHGAVCPLYIAARNGKMGTVRALLQRGANVNQETNLFETALMGASWDGRTEVIKLLLDHGAVVGKGNCEGELPMYAAAEGGHSAIVTLLLNHGASSCDSAEEKLHKGEKNDLGLLRQSGNGVGPGIDVNLGTNEEHEHPNSTALLGAARAGHVGVIKILLHHGADADKTDDGSMSPLHAAADGGHVEAVVVLLAAGAATDGCVS